MTSWSALDYSQLRVFVDGWKAQQNVLQHRRSGSNNSTNNTMGANASHNNSFSGSIAMPPATAMGYVDAAGDDMSTGSARRPGRRRTTGGLELKRDIAKLHQMQEMNSRISNMHLGGQQQQPPAPYGMSPKSMSPLGPSPQFAFGHKTFAGNNSNPTGTGSAMTSPIVHNNTTPQQQERRSFNNNNNNGTPSNISLLEYWQQLTGQNAASTGFGPQAFQPVGRGILVFERSNEVGLILRANPHYGIVEDLWCLYYPDDALQQFVTSMQMYNPNDTLAQSFIAYLMQLLPQTRCLMPFLVPDPQNSQSPGGANWRGPVTISYYAHRITANTASTPSAANNNAMNGNNGDGSGNPLQWVAQQGPPAAPASGQQYRTLGSIDQNCHLILSR